MNKKHNDIQFPQNVLEEIKMHLLEEKKKTLERITELTAQDPFSDPERANDNASSDGDANEESSHDRFIAMVEEQKKHVTALDEALSRITLGTYGTCMACGTLIDTDRLAILPTAQYCHTCETEKSKKLFNDHTNFI